MDKDYVMINLSDCNYDYIGINKILFNTQKYLSEIIKSYNNLSHKIIKQFILDCPRQVICINKTRINCVYQFITMLSKYQNKSVEINGKKFNLLTLLLMLSCQSSFAMPFIIINSLYDYDNRLVIVDNNTPKKISFNTCDNGIDVIVECKFALKNVIKCKTKLTFSVKLVLKVRDGMFCENGVFGWIVEY